MRKTGLPGDSVVKNLSAHTGDMFDPQIRKITWGRNGNPLQYSCLGNPTDRGAWWKQSMGLQKAEQLNNYVRKITSSSRTKVDRFT